MHKITEGSSARFWDSKAQGYAKSAISDMSAYEQTLTRVRAHLKPEDRVLEIGCGTGSTALALAPSLGHITASDLSEQMIRIGEQKARDQDCGNIDFLTAESMNPSLEPGQYDVVLAFNLLHLVDNPAATVARARELLKPGGLFISKTFCLPEKFSLKVQLIRLALPIMQLIRQAPAVRFMRVPELDQLVRDAGFSIVEQGAYPEHPPRRFLVAQKPSASEA